jgi:hypothetical protein
MPTTTANPTNSELRAYRAEMCANTSKSIDEFLRRLRVNLPVEIALRNADEGWTGNDAIEAVATNAIERANFPVGTSLTSIAINSVLVGLTTDAQILAPTALKRIVMVSVYDIHRKVDIPQQWKPIERRGDAIVTAMARFWEGCNDEDEVHCWTHLVFKSARILPAPYDKYAGQELVFQMTVTP